MTEGYSKEWKHCTIHLNPETGIMHSDGDHSVRHWIENKLKSQSSEGALKDAVIKQALVACESCMTHSAHISARDEVEVIAGILRDAPASTEQKPDILIVDEASDVTPEMFESASTRQR